MIVAFKDQACQHPQSFRQYCIKCYQVDYYREHGTFPPLVYDPKDDGVPAEALQAFIARQGPLN